MATGLRVLIVDDHTLFAEVIRSTLERLGMVVVGSVQSGRHGLEAAVRERPDLVLVDIGLPDESGLAVGSKILEQLPETKIVAVTSLNDPKAVAEAMRLGFHGYLSKNTPVERFVTSIQAVMEGEVVLPKAVAGPAAAPLSPEDREAALLIRQLTPREREILALLAKGATSEDIATGLGLSPNTVRTHVQNILMKLQVNSRLKAAAFATRHGLVQPERRRG